MDVHDEPAVETDSPAETGSNLFERTITSVLTLLASGGHSIVLMLVAPHAFARRVVNDSPKLPPPYSFLLASLMLGGISIRIAVALFGQAVDHTVLGRMASTISSITLEDIFILTVPSIILVALAGAGVARWTRPHTAFQRNPVVRAVCYASGMQFSLIGLTCLLGLIIKSLRGTSSVMADHQLDNVVLFGIGYLVLAAALPVCHVIRLAGHTFWARSMITALPLSILACATVLVSVSITNSISFDLNSTIEEARQAYQREMLSDVSIAVRTLSSQMTRHPRGMPQIEMTVALVNVSHRPFVVPRPFELQHAVRPELEPLQVATASPGDPDHAGWIIQPGETRLIRWQLNVPAWLAEPDHLNAPLNVTFDCFPLNGIDDLFNTHPVGDPMIVYGQLSWPMTDAMKKQDRRRIDIIAAMLQEARFR